MKPIAVSSYLAFAALSLYAADPQASKDNTADPARYGQKVLSGPVAGGVADSPLVHAAKASNRLGKKPAMVITNETLVHSGGHFTTTTPEAQAQLAPPRRAAGPSLDQMAAEQRHEKAESAASAERTKKIEEQKKLATERNAARDQGDTAEALYDDPPALEGGPIPTMKPVAPPTMPTKPPQ